MNVNPSTQSMTPAGNPYQDSTLDFLLKNNNAPVEIPYNIPEQEFITFAHELFRPAINKPKFLTLSVSDEAQKSFYKWMADRRPRKYLMMNLDLNNIISSVWKKSRHNVYVDLKDRGTADIVENEKQLQKEAIAKEKEINSNDLSTKVFTHRQVNHLFFRAIKSKL